MKKLKLKKETEEQKIEKFFKLISKLIFRENQPLFSLDSELGQKMIKNQSKDPFTFKCPKK